MKQQNDDLRTNASNTYNHNMKYKSSRKKLAQMKNALEPSDQFPSQDHLKSQILAMGSLNTNLKDSINANSLDQRMKKSVGAKLNKQTNWGLHYA